MRLRITLLLTCALFLSAQNNNTPLMNDLPTVKKIRVTFHYPKRFGLKDTVEDPGGDLRAVKGTEAEVAIQTDKYLNKVVLITNGHHQIGLKASEENWFTARVPINRDGVYHVAAIEQSGIVRMTEDFFIEARRAPSTAF